MENSDFMKKIKEFLKGKKFESIEEANRALWEFIEKLNNTPLEEFCGLSPNKMTDILNFPFDSPDVVSFNMNVSPPFDSPFVTIFILLINGIHKGCGIKVTCTGNLSRNFCREIEKAYLTEEDFKFILRDKFPIMKEQDSIEIHIVRIISEMAGYIRKYKNKFILTKKGEKIITDGFKIDDYLHLLKIFTLRYNWAYTDLYGKIDIIQDSFLFTLYLLQKFGDKFRPKSFYADRFFTAFENSLRDILREIRTPFPSVKEVKDAYIHRAINRFAIFLGFAEAPDKSFNKGIFHKDVKKTDFLDNFIKFIP
jgi:hypothetical protein